MTLTDGYGRDLAYLRAHRPRKAPGRWARLVNVVWPLASVELWDSWASVERANSRLEADTIDGLLKGIAAK